MNKGLKMFLLGFVMFLAGVGLFIYSGGIDTLKSGDFGKIAFVFVGGVVIFIIFLPYANKLINKIK